ncbi:mucin-1 [Balearica regulorum gibbericeps]|uniref:mucin-1 n=1 Tax=Balearica regulorum gibbericeps TaxID=100784 RepID=UPI003F5EC5D2
MAVTALLLLLVLGAGTCAMVPAQITTETTTTDTTTTETTTTDTTTTETTTETTTTPMTVTPSIQISKNTSSNGTQTSVSSHTTVFPATGNTTNFQSNNGSARNATAKSTAVPISSSPAISYANATANSSNWVPPFATNTTKSSSVAPTSPVGGGTVIPISSAKGNGSNSAQVIPTRKTSVTTQGSTAPRQTPTAVLGSSGAPNPSKAAALRPTAVQLLLRVPLSFRIINRSFNESLRDPTSKDYRSLSHTVLTMFEYVFGCASCTGRQTYKGCSELRFSQGSVEVQSTLVFGQGNDTVTSTAAEQQLRNSLDQNGFIMDLQLASIQSTVVTSPAPVPVVPDWAIALLVLVCILLLLSILTCFLMTTCTCRRKSRGKLDLLSTKDSYHPMAEYPPYQSHGRYVSPNSKPNPYSQVAGSNCAGAGTFTYTNPSAASDNL